MYIFLEKTDVLAAHETLHDEGACANLVSTTVLESFADYLAMLKKKAAESK